MVPLLNELIARGALDASSSSWAQTHQAEHGGALSSVLLELDLVDEEDLLHALSSSFGLPCATAEDLSMLSPDLALRFPEGFSSAFDLCPLRLESPELVVLVSSPLSAESRHELHELFHLELRQLLCHAHTLTLARDRVYGREPDERTRALEARLERKRRGGRVREAVARVSTAASFSSAANDVLRFANALLDFAVFLRTDGAHLRVAAGGSGHTVPPAVAAPEGGCTLAAAMRHGSFFLGPLAGNAADLRFFESLGRAVPRWAFVAPLPSSGARRVVLYADNGPLGMAPRWLAELTLLVARLGQLTSTRSPAVTIIEDPDSEPEIELIPAPEDTDDSASLPPEDEQTEMASALPAEKRESKPAIPPEARDPAAIETGERAIDPGERVILDRLRAAAQQAGVELPAFVDELLAQRGVRAPADTTAALMGEVRGLFERLATDIPAQMALGMQNAFRDIVPRLSTSQPVAPTAVRSGPVASSAAASVDLVVAEAKPREVPSYRSRRSKADKIKL